MTPDEIRHLYEELSSSEFFEAMDTAMVDNATIEEALGPEVAQEYSNWIYFNIK